MSRIWHVAGQGPVGGEDQLLTAAGRALIDDASADAQLTTLGITVAGKALLDDVNAAAQLTTLGVTSAARDFLDDTTVAAELATLGLDADIGTFALPANTTISTAGKALIDDATAADQLETLGLTATAAELNQLEGKTITAAGAALLDDASATVQIATLGLDADIATLALPANTTITAAGAAILDDANAAAQLVTLGLTPLAAELNYVDGVTSAIQTQLDDKKSIPIFSRQQELENDCYSVYVSGFSPLTPLAVGAGTLVSPAAGVNHPGVVSIKSSTTPNSGYVFTGGTLFIIGGGEMAEFIFQLDTAANSLAKFGYHNTATYSDPTYGAWIDINATTLSGKTSKNSTQSVTASTYTLTAAVWYRAKLVVNAANNLVTFTLNTCADGAQVWTDTVAANIPNGYLGPNIIATNGGSSAVSIVDLDWFHFKTVRTLVR